MNLTRTMSSICTAVACITIMTRVASADEQRTKSVFEQRAMNYDEALVTPPHVSAEQHHLLAVTLAAHHSQIDDPAEIMRVLDQLAVMVTYLRQSDTTFWWDGAQWVPSNRTICTYSGTNLVESIAQSSGDAINWVNETKQVNAYDGGGKLTSITLSGWVGSAWVNQSMMSFTYDGSGNLATSLDQEWGGSDWVNQFYSTMTYSGSNLATMTTQIWSSGMWVNMRKDIFTYGADGVTEMLTQSWTGAWNDAERVVYSYDGSGRRTQSLSQLWRSSAWRNWFKNDYSYDGATENEILDVHSDWDTVGNVWNESYADTSRYAANKVIETVTAYFTFPFSTRMLYSYDGFGNLSETINQNGPGPSWMNFSRIVYVYIIAGIFDEETAEMPAAFEIAHNYPNPFNLGTVIEYTMERDGRVQLSIVNLLGQTVRTLVEAERPAGRHTAVWDGRDTSGKALSSGVYLLRVQTAGIAQTRKMVLLK